VIVNDAYVTLFTSKKRYNVLKGSAGAGKSHGIGQFLITECIQRDNFNVLGVHKIAEKIRTTLYAELIDVIERNNFSSLFTITSSPQLIKNNANGNTIGFTGMDNPDKLRSISGIDVIWMEEADMFTVEDFLQVDSRLRKSENDKIIISFNPTSELSWLKSTFFDEGNEYADDSLLIETTYKHNRFLPQSFIKGLERTAKTAPNYYRVYALGEWGQVSSDGLFYKQFSSFDHVSTTAEYNPNLPIWLSFDFNVQPYCACTAWQIQPDGKTIYLVDEYTLRSPNNTTKYVCREFKRRHPTHTAGLFITGDPNGKKNDTRSEQGYNDYSIIQNELVIYHPSVRVATKAPPIVPRGGFINAIFSENFNGLSILINPKCKKTLEDLTYQKESITGKDKKKGKLNGVIVELLGHCSDTLDYLLCQVFSSDFELYQRGKRSIPYIIGKPQTNSRFLI
jgi:phage terminase large subunit